MIVKPKNINKLYRLYKAMTQEAQRILFHAIQSFRLIFNPRILSPWKCCICLIQERKPQEQKKAITG